VEVLSFAMLDFPARVAASGHWPEVQLFTANQELRFRRRNVKKDDKRQGLFDFGIIAA
jgi:hypothetical protein